MNEENKSNLFVLQIEFEDWIFMTSEGIGNKNLFDYKVFMGKYRILAIIRRSWIEAAPKGLFVMFLRQFSTIFLYKNKEK